MPIVCRLPRHTWPHLGLWGGLTLITAPGLAVAQATFAPTMLEYSWSSSVNQLRVKGVHGKGILGQNVTVALLDTGLNLANPEFARNPRVLTPYNAVDGSSDVADTINHGTHVAGIVGAGGDGSGMYGVAPLANLLMVKVFNGGTASATNINRGMDYAIAQGARVVNMSFGTTSPLGDAGLKRAAATNQAVLVVAAGNEGARTPNWPARYAKETWANGTMLVVGAVDASGRLASFSNRAGDLAPFYLVAPGVSILSSLGTGYGYMSGTSMAAPAVSGAAALVTGYWPYLKANQVAAILLNTADDLGAPGVDAVYGHGMLNVNRALAPIGRYTYRAASGRTVSLGLSTPGVVVRQPAAVTPSAFAALQTEVFDDYGRNFTSDEGQTLRVRTALTTDMVMGRPDLDATVADHADTPGMRWRTWSIQPATPVMRAAPQGVMSPLSAGLRPPYAREGAREDTQPHGAMQWQATSGWSFSAGDAGLSAPSLGLAGALQASGQAQRLAGTETLLASPLSALAPQHRFAVVGVPLSPPAGSDDNAPAPAWQARLATLRPELPTGVQAARGHVSQFELSGTWRTTAWALSLGQLDEQGLLGGYSAAPLGLATAHRTLAFSASGAWLWSPHWAAVAAWSRTRTAAPEASGLLLGGSALRGQAMAAGLLGQSLWRTDDRLQLSWFAPLKVTSGLYRYGVTTGVDDAGQAIYGQQVVNLGEGAREWQLEGRYGWPARHGQWQAALTWRVHPDHDAGAPNQWAGGVRYQRAF